MAQPKSKSNRPRKRTWRDYPEYLIPALVQPASAESLHPGPDTVLRAICGNAEARAIFDAYAFRFPVTIVQGVIA